MENKTKYPRMHVSLHVKSIDETVGFYTKFFGTEPAKIKRGYAKYELDEPALTISFIENRKEVQSGFGHLGIQVKTKEELNNKLNLAGDHELVQREEVGIACCYAIQDKFWVNDPDGYEWEIYRFLDDVEVNDSKDDKEGSICCATQETEKATACC